jgi:sulfur relay (sulfurtransferase) complex TusBCD TusD component (DsrE family)
MFYWRKLSGDAAKAISAVPICHSCIYKRGRLNNDVGRTGLKGNLHTYMGLSGQA